MENVDNLPPQEAHRRRRRGRKRRATRRATQRATMQNQWEVDCWQRARLGQAEWPTTRRRAESKASLQCSAAWRRPSTRCATQRARQWSRAVQNQAQVDRRLLAEWPTTHLVESKASQCWVAWRERQATRPTIQPTIRRWPTIRHWPTIRSVQSRRQTAAKLRELEVAAAVTAASPKQPRMQSPVAKQL